MTRIITDKHTYVVLLGRRDIVTDLQQIFLYLPRSLHEPISRLTNRDKEQLHEIRLRAEMPVVLTTTDGYFFIDFEGRLHNCFQKQTLVCTKADLDQTVRMICEFSIHTYQRELTKGYITIPGGHRVGIASTAVVKESEIASVKDISSVNIRVARQVKGLADPIVAYAEIGGVLVIGCPGSGKTTVLRDLARQLSGEQNPRNKVVLIDERGELAAVYNGKPQNDIGVNTDVLNGFPKTTAMELATRSLSPQVMICDEIGSRQEAEEIMVCVHAGIRIVASLHANSLEEIQRKSWAMALIRSKAFETLVLLDGDQGKGRVERIVKTNDWLAEIYGDHIADFDYQFNRYPHLNAI